MMLADMGAEVIKIEQPGRGDDTRHFAPFRNGESAYYMNLNRGKQGVTPDLKAGRELFLDLVKTADVVVENYRPGTMEKLGLGYDTLKAVNSRLVYAAVSGFGDTGPYRLRPGYDIIAQAMGGLMSTTGCETIDQPAMASDELFDTNAKRVQRHAAIKPLIEQWTRVHTVDEIVEKMLAAGVPASPINTVDRLVVDPHIAVAREMFVDVNHPVAGKTKLTGCHIKLGATPARIAAPAPLLGQHNELVFAGLLGFDGERLASLREAGVI